MADHEGTLYRAFGLIRGYVWQYINPKVVWRSFVALYNGHINGMPRGNTLRMPGVFLIHNSKIVKKFVHPSVSDLPDYVALSRM